MQSGAAAEAGTIGEQQLEADANGEQQLKRCNRAREQQLIRSRRKLSGAGLYTHGRRTNPLLEASGKGAIEKPSHAGVI